MLLLARALLRSVALVRVGGEPCFIIVQELPAAAKAVTKLVVQPLETSDLLIFIAIRHAKRPTDQCYDGIRYRLFLPSIAHI